MGGDTTVSWLFGQNHKKVEIVDSECIVGFKVLVLALWMGDIMAFSVKKNQAM